MDIETVTLSRDGKSDAEYIAELEDAVYKMSCQTEFFLDSMSVSLEALEEVVNEYANTKNADQMVKYADLALTILYEDSDSQCH